MARDTRTRILDAAIATMGRHGLARLSLEGVAREAGVSRQTLYRYFGSRDALISATVLREEEAFIAAMVAAADHHREFRPALEAAIAQALRSARAHPLLDRLLATEPDALLPFLTMGRGPVLSAAKPVVRDLLAARLDHLTDPELSRIAEAATRLIVSYAISPADDDIDDVAAGLADLIANGVKPR
jgi:AcrR family transcriptional regulator